MRVLLCDMLLQFTMSVQIIGENKSPSRRESATPSRLTFLLMLFVGVSLFKGIGY